MILALLTAALAASQPAKPADPEAAVMARLAPAFHGTIVSTYPDGATGRLLVNRDKTYRYTGRAGKKSGGTWGLNGEKTEICLKQRQPIFIPLGYCTPIPQGRTWTAKAVDGQMVRLHLMAGRRA